MTNFSVVDSKGNPRKEQFEIDTRTPLNEIVELIKQRLAIPSDFQYRKVVVYKCGYFNQHETVICNTEQ